MYGALISATDPVSVLAIFQVLIYILSQICTETCTPVLLPNHCRCWVIAHGRYDQIASFGYKMLSKEGTLACIPTPTEELIFYTSYIRGLAGFIFCRLTLYVSDGFRTDHIL